MCEVQIRAGAVCQSGLFKSAVKHIEIISQLGLSNGTFALGIFCPRCHGPAGVPRLATRCLCVLSTWLVVCLVPCAPMSIVCPLPSCYLIIVSVAPAVSPSLPSFVSLYSLLVSAVLC